MKKTIEGNLFNRIEEFGDKKYSHVGFEDDDKNFGSLIESFVPKVGMKRKVRLTIELLEE